MTRTMCRPLGTGTGTSKQSHARFTDGGGISSTMRSSTKIRYASGATAGTSHPILTVRVGEQAVADIATAINSVGLVTSADLPDDLQPSRSTWSGGGGGVATARVERERTAGSVRSVHHAFITDWCCNLVGL